MVLYTCCADFLVFAGTGKIKSGLDPVYELNVTGDRTCLILRT